MKLKKIGKLFTSKFVGAGPSSYKKRIYRAAVCQRLRNTGLEYVPKQNTDIYVAKQVGTFFQSSGTIIIYSLISIHACKLACNYWI
jgi:hypothetical protein